MKHGRPCDGAGRPAGALQLHREDSRRGELAKAALEYLEGPEDTLDFKEILDHVQVCVSVIESSGRALYVNPTHVAETGVPAAEMLGVPSTNWRKPAPSTPTW